MQCLANSPGDFANGIFHGTRNLIYHALTDKCIITGDLPDPSF